MNREDERDDVRALREKLEREEAAYAPLLARIDALAAFALPYETKPDLPEEMRRLNESWQGPPPADDAISRRAFVAPVRTGPASRHHNR